MDKSLLLSICIPTYNGGQFLKRTIDCLVASIGKRDDIEVIVSDNCSNEETKSIVGSYVKEGFIRANYNTHNLGFNGNLMVLLEDFAQGEYCWVLGDDDYVDSDTIDLIYPLLKEKKMDYISVNCKSLTQKQYETYQVPKGRELSYNEGDFFKCIDLNSSEGNVLGTFMSSHIFKLASVKRVGIRDEYRSNAWDNFLNVFPNSNLMLDTFHSSNNCARVETPLITAVIREKTYSDKWDFLTFNILPDLYAHYLEVAGTPNKLKRSKLIMDNVIAWTNFRNAQRGNNKNVDYRLLFSYKTLRSVFSHFFS